MQRRKVDPFLICVPLCLLRVQKMFLFLFAAAWHLGVGPSDFITYTSPPRFRRIHSAVISVTNSPKNSQ
jgi:hypothetical protein